MLSIAFKKCEPLLCIPVLLTTLCIDAVLHVVKSGYFVVHPLMLPQILINSVYGLGVLSVSSGIPAALGGGGGGCPGVGAPQGVQILLFAS